MGIKTSCRPDTHLWIAMAVLAVAGLSSSGAQAQGTPVVRVTVQNDLGQPLGNGFRWILEEDNSYGAVPGVASVSLGGKWSSKIHPDQNPVAPTTSSSPSRAK